MRDVATRPLEEPAPGLPRWYVLVRRYLIATYVGVMVACVAAAFFLQLISVVVYRNFRSYTLYGSPWGHTSFPWYEIDSMRAMSIVGGMAILGITFVGLYFAALYVSLMIAKPTGSGLLRRITCLGIAGLLLLAAAAWFGRWFG